MISPTLHSHLLESCSAYLIEGLNFNNEKILTALGQVIDGALRDCDWPTVIDILDEGFPVNYSPKGHESLSSKVYSCCVSGGQVNYHMRYGERIDGWEEVIKKMIEKGATFREPTNITHRPQPIEDADKWLEYIEQAKQNGGRDVSGFEERLKTFLQLTSNRKDIVNRDFDESMKTTLLTSIDKFLESVGTMTPPTTVKKTPHAPVASPTPPEFGEAPPVEPVITRNSRKFGELRMWEAFHIPGLSRVYVKVGPSEGEVVGSNERLSFQQNEVVEQCQEQCCKDPSAQIEHALV